MRIIPRYMLRHFFPVFALSLTGFVGIYLIVDFFEKIDPMLQRNLSWVEIYSYFLFKIPLILTQGIPMAAILSSIISLGLLKRNRELMAMETAGVNPAYYVSSIVVVALFLAVIHFSINEFMARQLNAKLQETWDVKVKQKKPPVWWNPENMWYRDGNTIYQIRLYNRRAKSMEKVSIFFLDPQFRLMQRLDAKRISWREGAWIAEDGLTVLFNGPSTDQEWFERRKLDLNITPQDFVGRGNFPEDLGWFDLHEYIEKIEQEGFTSTSYRVELYQRLASPVATFLLALIGIIVALNQGLHGGIAAGVGISMAVAFSFLVVSSVGSGLAGAGTLPPFLGVWIGNIIFAALACYAWIRKYM
ncbi:MAG: LPS export ABC transporter permease LptG [Syntrophobacteraceae bacterium]